MATPYLKIKSCWKSDRQKRTKNDLKCNETEPESAMKFSFKCIESPPPKPPRRRYSDQLSMSSLAVSSTKKHNEEVMKTEPKSTELNPEPAYLSLPANLTAKHFNECNDTPVSFSQSFTLFDQRKHSKESDYCGKGISGNENRIKQEHLRSIEKYQEIDYDALFQRGNAVAHFQDKFYENSSGNTRVFLTNKCTNKNSQPIYKDCHRRHNSDPVISNVDLQNADFDQENSWDNIPASHKKGNKLCQFLEACTCCRKSYFYTEEIRNLKETNEKLWQHLCSLLNYVENVWKKSCDESPDISVSDLLSSVYYAQKARDCAMEERLKILLDEREIAIREYENLFQLMTKSFDNVEEKNSEKDIQKLIAEIESTCNPSKLLHNQKMLLAQIYKLKESNSDCLSQQLKKAEIERDNALDKVRTLEEEVKELQLSYDVWHSDNKHWEFTILAILNQLLHQRDTILSKVDNGMDLSNIICWPPKSSKLGSLEQQQNASVFDSYFKRVDSIKNHYLNEYKSKHSIGTCDEVTTLKEEIFRLNKALECEMEKRELAEGKCVKLERLTHILRKKLNGQNIGVFV